jgi:hypothetical protein
VTLSVRANALISKYMSAMAPMPENLPNLSETTTHKVVKYVEMTDKYGNDASMPLFYMQRS